jgi:hypothetical protein
MEWVLLFFFLQGATAPDTVAPAQIDTIGGFASRQLCEAAIATLKASMAAPMPPGTAKPMSFMVCLQQK